MTARSYQLDGVDVIEIQESGMSFGPFDEDSCFRIEDSRSHKAAQPGIKIAEFLLIRERNGSPMVLVIEAKSSSPKPGNDTKLPEYIEEIGAKLLNAFSLAMALMIGRFAETQDELPLAFSKLNLANTDFQFVLVIHGHQAGWLPPLKEALAKSLYTTMRTWRLSAKAVVVLNDDMARAHHLIS